MLMSRVAGAVRSLVENREDEGRIGSPGKSTGADGKVRIEWVDGLDGSGAGQHVEDAIDNPALEEPARKGLSDSQRLVHQRCRVDDGRIGDRLDRSVRRGVERRRQRYAQDQGNEPGSSSHISLRRPGISRAARRKLAIEGNRRGIGFVSDGSCPTRGEYDFRPSGSLTCPRRESCSNRSKTCQMIRRRTSWREDLGSTSRRSWRGLPRWR